MHDNKTEENSLQILQLFREEFWLDGQNPPPCQEGKALYEPNQIVFPPQRMSSFLMIIMQQTLCEVYCQFKEDEFHFDIIILWKFVI